MVVTRRDEGYQAIDVPAGIPAGRKVQGRLQVGGRPAMSFRRLTPTILMRRLQVGTLPVSTLAAVAGVREHVHAGVAARGRFRRGACALATDAI
jgi:hypothetical protein